MPLQILMQSPAKHKTDPYNKKSVFEYFAEVMGWLQIMASPFLIAVILSAIIYFSNPSKTRLVFAILTTLTGLGIGILWATKVWKKRGTTHFISRIMSTPELDAKDDERN